MKNEKGIIGVLSDSFWGTLAKILDAVVKFITIPLLTLYFGKANYGLIALVISLNAYMKLMDLGINIGSVRFFSIWISKKEWQSLLNVVNSSTVFYTCIGFLNALLFTFLSIYGVDLLNIPAELGHTFFFMMNIMAVSSIVSWFSNVANQLLIARGEITWTNKVSIISSLLNFAFSFLVIKMKLSIEWYFALYMISILIVVPFNLFRLNIFQSVGLSTRRLLTFKWNFQAFKEVLTYGVSILAMGIFQFSADNLRPILLSKFSTSGIEAVADFRILQTITILLMSIGAVFRQVFLPLASEMYAKNEHEKIKELILNGTKYITAFFSFLVFLLACVSGELLNIYVGDNYSNLSMWLILWLLTCLISLHKSIIDSFILAAGHTKPLIYTSAIGCIISIPLTAILAKEYNVGGAVIAYLAYTIIEVAIYYLYILNTYFSIKGSIILFKSVLPSLFISISIFLIINKFFSYVVKWDNDNLQLFSKVICFSILFIISFWFYLSKSEKQNLYSIIRKKINGLKR